MDDDICELIIRHYGLLAGSDRKACLALARMLLGSPTDLLTTSPMSLSTIARH